ncbi:laccase domain-containing protein [Erysipelotrichaceae bacterium RD49]|nr:laccase domain-containing protein [Erysipelotrichaceae bacterium RD49]
MTVNHLNRLVFSDQIIHGCFTLRTPGALESGNLALHVCLDPMDVMENRKLLQKDTLSLDVWCLPWQKHTNRVVRVSKKEAGRGAYEAESSILETDGLYTTDPGLLIGVFTADCLGILFSDPTIPLIGAVHSGWKGTAQAITLKLIEALKADGLYHPQTLKVYFSPSLMVHSLEVGPEVVDQVCQMADQNHLSLEGCILPGQGNRSYLDNQLVNVRMLESQGIRPENIHLSNLDTKTSPYGFSYRRDGSKTGEHFSCIWIEDQKPHLFLTSDSLLGKPDSCWNCLLSADPCKSSQDSQS